MKGNKKQRWIMFFLLITLVGALAACDARLEVGETRTQEETVSREDASRVDVDLRMGAGKLSIGGGAQDLLEAAFTYNIADWEPQVDYEVGDGTGRLSVTQPDVDAIGIPDNDIRYEWDLRFNEDTPLDMEINLGAGESNLNLADLSLRTLRMNTGAGQVDVNLGGTLEDFRLDTGAGEINLNLAHAWEQDTEGRINGGIGSITVLLPSSTGVQVTVRQGIGSVDAPGFARDGNSYTNDAYGESEVTLDLTIEGGIGEVNLREGG